jgi:hypothetical protein
MSAGNWLTLVGIVVGGFVALAVAHMHRKQMRQIELHRADPTVPLVPPPHPITRFLKSYGIYGWCIAWTTYDAFLLVRDLGKPTPVTREAVALIVVDMIGIVLMIAFGVGTWVSNRATNLAGRTLGIIEKLTDMVLSLDARVKKLEEVRTVMPASEPSASETLTKLSPKPPKRA